MANSPAVEDALRSLETGDWDAAHRIVQALDGPEAAWIHAHLHRFEGDAGNAATGIGKPDDRCRRMIWIGSEARS